MSMRAFKMAALAVTLLLASPVVAQTAAPSTTAKTPATNMAPSAAPAAKSTTAATSPQAGLIDINRATKQELDALPGIGSARADAIIKGRPYRAKNELADKKIIPQPTYDAIKDKIVARQKS
jgi:competence protein ComEA